MSGEEIHRDFQVLRMSIPDRCASAISYATTPDPTPGELPAPAALTLTCELESGHTEQHRSGVFTWTRYEAGGPTTATDHADPWGAAEKARRRIIGERITQEIEKDPAEVERLRAARREVREGRLIRRHCDDEAS